MAHGMLAGAEAVPMHPVPLQLEAWRSKKKIVAYCRTGVRPGQVCAWLQQQGVEQPINLSGGITGWHRQGYPVEKPDTVGMID